MRALQHGDPHPGPLHPGDVPHGVRLHTAARLRDGRSQSTAGTANEEHWRMGKHLMRLNYVLVHHHHNRAYSVIPVCVFIFFGGVNKFVVHYLDITWCKWPPYIDDVHVPQPSQWDWFSTCSLCSIIIPSQRPSYIELALCWRMSVCHKLLKLVGKSIQRIFMFELVIMLWSVVFQTKTLVYYTGYEESELLPLAQRLNNYIKNPPKQLTTIRSKYSHK